MSDAIERARQIAKKVLAGEYDPLLACREIAMMKDDLAAVPDDVMTGFRAIDSEVDGLPLGPERAYWDKEALREKDLSAANYREQVREGIEEDLRALLSHLLRIAITLDYQLHPLSRDHPDRDLATADATDLRYRLFLGNVFFRVGEADFSASWGWVPVLDFALGLEYVARELRHGMMEAEFDFTESESTIRFRRDDEDVLISASYTSHRAVVNLEHLVDAVRVFRKRVIDDLSQLHPQLRMNSTIRNYTD
jgi:hypothetical protein